MNTQIDAQNNTHNWEQYVKVLLKYHSDYESFQQKVNELLDEQQRLQKVRSFLVSQLNPDLDGHFETVLWDNYVAIPTHRIHSYIKVESREHERTVSIVPVNRVNS